MTETSVWPDVNVAAWASTKRSLHLYLQMLGKMRISLSPAQPNWIHTALPFTARGVTTAPMPWRGTTLEARYDVFASEITLDRSDGRSERIPLLPVRTVADVYAALQNALRKLEVDCTITPAPQELPDTTPLSDDTRECEYDPAAVQRWFAGATATAAIFDAWRAPFFGRSTLQLWWGALDVSLMLFSGKKVTAPTDRGFIMKYDLDAELMNVGLFYGDEKTAPYFYGYIYPQPDNAPDLDMKPSAAAWNAQVKEWTMPYETVRSAADPAATLHAFCDAVYKQCIDAAGWDAAAHSYDAPPNAAGRR